MRTLSTLGLFAALALTAGCNTGSGQDVRQSGMGPATRGNAAAPMPSSATGQSAVTNPTMSGPMSGGGNRGYYLGSDPNFPRNETGVAGKPSGTGP